MLLSNTGMELAKFRRNNPGDDLMTSIVNAEVDGQRLTDEEIGAFLILLSSAGNDTTKQATTHAMMALVENPGPTDWLMEDFDDRIGRRPRNSSVGHRRCCSSRGSPRRTPRSADSRCSAGDKVGLFYCSANRDEAVFSDPGAFDLQRSPNPQLGFGGGGPHFCLGNQLAKAELRNLFRELLTRLKTVEFGEPDLLYSSFVHGIKRVPAFVSSGVTMRVEVDLDKCTGHGICESIADDVFEVPDDGVVVIHDNERPESDRDRMQQAVTQCPVSALRLSE